MSNYESNLEKSLEDELSQLSRLVEDDIKRISDYKKYVANITKQLVRRLAPLLV